MKVLTTNQYSEHFKLLICTDKYRHLKEKPAALKAFRWGFWAEAKNTNLRDVLREHPKNNDEVLDGYDESMKFRKSM